MNSLIYLAGPYSYDPEAAFKLHLDYTAAILRNGLFVYSPIVHNHLVAKSYNLPTDADYWKTLNYVMVMKSDQLWVINEPGWKTSRGTQYEISIAEFNSKVIKQILLVEGVLTVKPARNGVL